VLLDGEDPGQHGEEHGLIAADAHEGEIDEGVEAETGLAQTREVEVD
jgi:hypothetical protein